MAAYLWFKRIFTKCLYDGRSRIFYCHFFIFLVGILYDFKLSFKQSLICIYSLIHSVIIFILLIGKCRYISCSYGKLPIDTTCCISKYNRLKTTFVKHFYGIFDHTLLSYRISYIHRLFRSNIYTHGFKSVYKTVYIGFCHCFNFFFGKFI